MTRVALQPDSRQVVLAVLAFAKDSVALIDMVASFDPEQVASFDAEVDLISPVGDEPTRPGWRPSEFVAAAVRDTVARDRKMVIVFGYSGNTYRDCDPETRAALVSGVAWYHDGSVGRERTPADPPQFEVHFRPPVRLPEGGMQTFLNPRGA